MTLSGMLSVGLKFVYSKQGPHTMFYLALGLSISLTNLSAPLTCIAQLFCWRGANEVIVQETEHPDQVPKTVEEMRKLIKDIKDSNISSVPKADK